MAIAPDSYPGHVLIGISISTLVLSWITVVVRIWVRRWIKGLGLDDLLMVISLIMFTLLAQSLLSAAYNGVGTLDIYLDEATRREGLRWLWAGQVIYTSTAFVIKCSICTALLRITKDRKYRYPLLAVIALCAIASAATTLTLLIRCRPITANWDTNVGTCSHPSILTNISYYYSANSILTDWTCAILPGFILWNVQLKTRVKLGIFVLLAMGVVASVATIVRLAYFTAYTSPVNYMYGVANIAVWTMLECGIGIIAGSMATFRPLFRFVPFLSQSSYAIKSSERNGQSHNLNELNGNHRYGNRAQCEFGDIERSDTESQTHILKETKVEVVRKSKNIRVQS